MAVPALPPPPMDNELNQGGKASPPWARWLQQLWNSARLVIADEGTTVLTTPNKIDFVGSGVTVTDGGSGTATVTISGGGGGTRVFAEYTRTTAQSIAANSWVILDYATLVEDTDTAVTTGASWKFTAPSDGDYLVHATMMLDNASGDSGAGETWTTALYKNNAIWARGMFINPPSYAPLDWLFHGTWVIKLAATDYIDVRLFHLSSVDPCNTTANSYDNRIVIRKLN